MSCYRFINAEHSHYLVRRLCQALDVPTSGYKVCNYEELFEAEVLRLTNWSRSAQRMARQLHISPRLFRHWE